MFSTPTKQKIFSLHPQPIKLKIFLNPTNIIKHILQLHTKEKGFLSVLYGTMSVPYSTLRFFGL